MIVFISKIEILSIRTFHFGINIEHLCAPQSRRRPKSPHRTGVISLNFSLELSACGGSENDAESTEDWTERLLLTGCAVLTACASGEQTKTLRQVDATEIAAAAGCSRDEVAVCGLLFVGCLFFAPLAQSVPAVVVAIAMPLSFSIAEGIGLGFITYVLIKLISGKASDCSVAVYVIAGIFILKYLFL